MEQQIEQNETRTQKQQGMIDRRNLEIEEMKMALEEQQRSIKNLNTDKKRLEVANNELECKLKAERAERMSMSNNSFVS